jgi:hypothetical protein
LSRYTSSRQADASYARPRSTLLLRSILKSARASHRRDRLAQNPELKHGSRICAASRIREPRRIRSTLAPRLRPDRHAPRWRAPPKMRQRFHLAAEQLRANVHTLTQPRPPPETAGWNVCASAVRVAYRCSRPMHTHGLAKQEREIAQHLIGPPCAHLCITQTSSHTQPPFVYLVRQRAIGVFRRPPG